MNTTTTTKHCSDCGQPFEALSIAVMGVTITATRCATCDDQAEQAWQRQRASITDPEAPKTRAEIFAARAKAAGFGRFLDFDPAKALIPNFDPGAGCFLGGNSGIGKTYLAVEAMRQKFHAGESIAMVDAIMFGIEVANVSSDRREQAIEAAIAPAWLLIDDLGKGKLTDRAAEALFCVISRRENFERRTIITANATPARLRDMLPTEYREALAERIFRTCPPARITQTENQA